MQGGVGVRICMCVYRTETDRGKVEFSLHLQLSIKDLSPRLTLVFLARWARASRTSGGVTRP